MGVNEKGRFIIADPRALVTALDALHTEGASKNERWQVDDNLSRIAVLADTSMLTPGLLDALCRASIKLNLTYEVLVVMLCCFVGCDDEEQKRYALRACDLIKLSSLALKKRVLHQVCVQLAAAYVDEKEEAVDNAEEGFLVRLDSDTDPTLNPDTIRAYDSDKDWPLIYGALNKLDRFATIAIIKDLLAEMAPDKKWK